LEIVGIVPNGPVTTVQEVQQIYDAFVLTFMDRTAWRKQKRYMASGSIQKPKSWSLQQVATRLTTLYRYLPYLPGTAQSFTEDEMKDMLVYMHSPAYHHLMARANYDVDAHSYLEITQFLQNLGLIKESFNKGNAQHNKHGNRQ
jgi:GH43 family beta-xylosidase